MRISQSPEVLEKYRKVSWILSIEILIELEIII